MRARYRLLIYPPRIFVFFFCINNNSMNKVFNKRHAPKNTEHTQIGTEFLVLSSIIILCKILSQFIIIYCNATHNTEDIYVHKIQKHTQTQAVNLKFSRKRNLVDFYL